MYFPQLRLRRLRKNERIRRLVRETVLRVDDFIYPLFVCTGKGLKTPISSMVGQFQLSIDHVIEEVEEAEGLGIPGVILFGIPERKDEMGTEAYSDDGIIQRAVRAIKEELPDFLVITDVCLCEYTSHGHCGVIKDNKIDNDPTCELLAKIALSHAQAGADIVAPSDMMDGRVSSIREVLEENDFKDVAIMSYAAKYASAFYGPFRDAAESAPAFGDRRTYQMDPDCGTEQALAEIALDIEEGADIVMVKPALAYLDIIAAARQRFDCPLAAYNVSGEYMMVKNSAAAGLLDGKVAMMELLTAIKRAGADILITYFAKEIASEIK
jgi:porphobilinogen synthase